MTGRLTRNQRLVVAVGSVLLGVRAAGAAAAGAGAAGGAAAPDGPTQPVAPAPPVSSSPAGPVAGPRDLPGRDLLTGDWFGLRPELAERGVAFEVLGVFEATQNFRGGIDRGATGQYLLNAAVRLDTDKLAGLPGGTLFLLYQDHAGGNPSAEDVGDFQFLSNLAADERHQLAEAWYEQVLAGGALRFKAGKIDANADFGLSQNAGRFLNSGMAYPISIAPLPTYPDPAFGVEAFVRPAEHWSLGVGVYDGALAGGVRTGANGPRTLLGAPADLFFVAEAAVSWELGPPALAGTLRAGGWYHNGTFERFDSGGARDGTGGAYVVLDQQLWRENPADATDRQGVGAFLVLDAADAAVMPGDYHAASGLAWTGLIPSRDHDVAGIGVSWFRFSRERGAGFTHDAETAVEAFYEVRVTPWLSVKPDLQYIHHPGGQDLHDALAGTIRVEVTF